MKYGYGHVCLLGLSKKMPSDTVKHHKMLHRGYGGGQSDGWSIQGWARGVRWGARAQVRPQAQELSSELWGPSDRQDLAVPGLE